MDSQSVCLEDETAKSEWIRLGDGVFRSSWGITEQLVCNAASTPLPRPMAPEAAI